MGTLIYGTALWVAAIGCGVMAGVYFSFSAFVMKALARLPPPDGIGAMQSINEVILASPFMVLFFGTSIAALGLGGYSLTHWGTPGTLALLSAASIYVVGMFVCTAAFNVPLNNALSIVDPSNPESVAVWSDYVGRWTAWNHLRTAASAIASGLFILAITTVS